MTFLANGHHLYVLLSIYVSSGYTQCATALKNGELSAFGSNFGMKHYEMAYVDIVSSVGHTPPNIGT